MWERAGFMSGGGEGSAPRGPGSTRSPAPKPLGCQDVLFLLQACARAAANRHNLNNQI